LEITLVWVAIIAASSGLIGAAISGIVTYTSMEWAGAFVASAGILKRGSRTIGIALSVLKDQVGTPDA